MSVGANFADIHLRGVPDRSMWGGTELSWEIPLIDWSTARNLSNWCSGVQIPRDIWTRVGRYLCSTRCSWLIRHNTELTQKIFHKDQSHPTKWTEDQRWKGLVSPTFCRLTPWQTRQDWMTDAYSVQLHGNFPSSVSQETPLTRTR